MKTLLITVFTLTVFSVTAQTTIEWVGGTPGKETNWDEPKNWSSHRVPDEFSNVVIPDVAATTQSYPVIRSGVVELNSLMLESQAKLTIQKDAQLVGFEQSPHQVIVLYHTYVIRHFPMEQETVAPVFTMN